MTEVRVPAIEFRQKHTRQFLFHMSASQLVKLVRSNPKTSSDPEGVQRLLKQNRLVSIAKYVSQLDSVLPNNIIVNLNSTVRLESTATNQVVTLVFPNNEGSFGEILDGQHRLYGTVHDQCTDKDMELPITALMLDDAKMAGKIFADINSTQRPVDRVLLVAIQQELGLLPRADDFAAALTDKLNEDSDSPLEGRIRMYQEQTDRPLTNDHCIKTLVPLLQPARTLIHLSANAAATLLKNYLTAVQELFPTEWADNKKYMLQRSAGFEVIMGLFDRAKERTGEPMPSAQQFKNSLQPIADTDWSADTFRGQRYTSSGGRTKLRDILLMKLPPPGI